MIRPDIEIIHQKETIFIKSEKHFFSFSRNNAETITAFCSADLTPAMITDIILSGIVSIINHTNGNLTFSPKFGYNSSKMEDVIIALFEKFDL